MGCPTEIKCDPKAQFSMATIPRCRGGNYSFFWIVPLTLDPYLIILSVKQGTIKYHFLSLWYESTWDEPWSCGPLANTLTPISMGRFGGIFIYGTRYYNCF